MPRHPPNALETLDRSHLQRPTPDASHRLYLPADSRLALRLDDQTGFPANPLQQTVSRSGTAQHLQSALIQLHRASETCVPSTSTPELDQHALHHVQKIKPAQQSRRPSVRRRKISVLPYEIDLLSGRRSQERVSRQEWWAREDLNFRPHAYQARALTN